MSEKRDRASKAPRVDQSPPASRQYLHGVQGLRTVAALMVAVYHVWFHRVSGGVDVFFVVAGYFAAGSMLRITSYGEARAWLSSVLHYWMRTARRVIPSASIVIFFTAILGLLYLPTTQWRSNIRHGIASLGFAENWYLIRVGNDYLQDGSATTAFQQFWALAIQVQSYLLFPLIALLAAFLARSLGRDPRQALRWTCSIVFVASIFYSLYFTSVDQPAAYYHLGTRFWEFSAGALLALFPSFSLNSRVARAVGWLGLLLILLFAAIVDPSQFLPGSIALVPVLGALAIIISSRETAEPKFLKSRAVLWFADSSFAFYLWHWPLLIFYRWNVSEDVSLLGGFLLLTVSALLAVVTTRFVETPVRTSRRLSNSWGATVVVSTAMLMMPSAALGSWELAYTKEVAAQEEQGGSDSRVDLFVPSTLAAADDISVAYGNGCHQGQTDRLVVPCEWGDLSADSLVALVGGSHETQWIDYLSELGAEHGFKVVSMLKSACPFGDMVHAEYEVMDECVEWSESALTEILELAPDLVVTMATRTIHGEEVFPSWKRSYLSTLSDAEISVLGVRDNPRFGIDVPDCVEELGPDECARPRQELLQPLEALAVPDLPYFTFLDTGDDYCFPDVCPVVKDEILLYRDSHHLTTTWTMLKGDRIGDPILEILSNS